jgi:predicted enzyme related to lactoylglutathione lyase
METIMNSSSTLLGVSFDTRDAAKVARFWAGALGRQVADGADIHNAVVLPADITATGPRLAFHQVPETKTVKNRVHFDLIATDLAAETERLQELGATIVRDVSEGGNHWITMADPEGNEFDLINI